MSINAETESRRDIVAHCNGMSKAEFWSLGMGDVQNLLDEAIEEIERLRAEIERLHCWIQNLSEEPAAADDERPSVYWTADGVKPYPSDNDGK